MMKCPWEEILGFKSHYEANDFTRWLGNQISGNLAEEVKINEPKLEDDLEERWFLHKESGAKWRLISPKGPSFTGSFRSLENKDKCPWNEIYGKNGFRDFADFENYYFWLEKQVKDGKAKEVPVENPIFCIDDKSSGEKWYVHVESKTLWRLVWPEREPYFERIQKTA